LLQGNGRTPSGSFSRKVLRCCTILVQQVSIFLRLLEELEPVVITDGLCGLIHLVVGGNRTHAIGYIDVLPDATTAPRCCRSLKARLMARPYRP
jgi:hypothetical protein